MLLIQEGDDDDAWARCRSYVEMVGLAEVAGKFPGELSGGMQQRVGIAQLSLLNYTHCSWMSLLAT